MRAIVATVLAAGLVGLAGAQDKKADPTGTWKWTAMFGDRKIEQTLKLKLDGDKLTGAMVGRNNMETAIEDGKYKDGEVSFTVTRERQGNKIVSKYKGKVEGDTLKMTSETEVGGETRKQEIEAKREKDK